MTRRVEFTPAARRDLAALSPDRRSRVDARILNLAANPRPSGVEKLAGHTNRYRIRVGDLRVIYEIHDRVLLVLVLVIGKRGEVYRRRR